MQVTIENFKALRSATISTKPGKLSVITGVNSSGKSSLIQSLLLFAQSASDRSGLVLNGRLVRLGSAQELVRQGAEYIEFILETEPDGRRDSSSNFHGKIRLLLKPSQQTSNLELTDVVGEISTDPKKRLRLSATGGVQADKLRISDEHPEEGNTVLHVKETIEGSRLSRTYVVFNGFSPLAIYRCSDEKTIRMDAARAFERAYKNARKNEKSEPNNRFNRGARRHVLGVLLALDHIENNVPSEDLTRLQELTSRGAKPRSSSRSLLPELEGATLKEVAVLYGQSMDVSGGVMLSVPSDERGFNPALSQHNLLNREFADSYSKSLAVLNTLKRSFGELATRLSYVGPLRDEPRVVWANWGSENRDLPVGVRGEFSAAVLQRFKNREVSFVRPGREKVERARLIDAVDAWLDFLGIGTGVSANSQGKLGVGLKLAVNGAHRDLTSVGVGVSQALPLVVALFRTPPEGMLVVEQPELHLHPAVQARLAEMFLLARPDIAVVVETHSEAFVTRVRRLCAEGRILPERAEVIFVEPIVRDAGAVCGPAESIARYLELNEMGDLNEWPAGFLAGEDDFLAIMEANASKFEKGVHGYGD